jgi:hypothetical protein
MLALVDEFRAEHPHAPAEAFEVWLDLRERQAALAEEPIPVSEDDVRQMLRTVGS